MGVKRTTGSGACIFRPPVNPPAFLAAFRQIYLSIYLPLPDSGIAGHKSAERKRHKTNDSTGATSQAAAQSFGRKTHVELNFTQIEAHTQAAGADHTPTTGHL